MKREPAPLPVFRRGPCPKCGEDVMRLRWCDGSIARSLRAEPCPDWNADHLHLLCPTCGYHTVCAPKDVTP
jgi:hypothetical protein